MHERPNLTGELPDLGRGGFAFGLLVITAVAAWLRFDDLTLRELWLDESCTFYWVHNLFNWPAEGPDPWNEPAHLPYFVLLHLWTRVAGEGEMGLRSFSAVCGLVTVVAIGLLGGAVAGRRVGLVAAALAAVHPLHVYYSQEARCYALWSLEITLCLWALLGAARTGRLRWWLVYGILAWIAVLTHYYALLWLPGTVGIVLLANDRRRCLWRWLKTHLVLGAALIPVGWFMILPYLDTGPKGWQRAMWLDYPPALAAPKSLWALMPSGGYPAAYLAPLAASAQAAEELLGPGVALIIRWMPAVTLATLYCGLLAAAGSRASAASPGRTDPKPRSVTVGCPAVIFFAFVSVVFLLLAVCQAVVFGQGYIVGRYDLVVWPSMIMVIALPIGRMGLLSRFRRHGSAVITALASVFLICSGLTLIGLRSLPATNQTRERALRIAAAVGPDDLLISAGLYRWFLEYEWHQLELSTRVLSFPPAHDRQLCWEDAEEELADPQRISADIRYVTRQIDSALERGTRVWLLAQGKAHGPRWEVDKRFFAALRERGIEIRSEDDWVGLARLVDNAHEQR